MQPLDRLWDHGSGGHRTTPTNSRSGFQEDPLSPDESVSTPSRSVRDTGSRIRDFQTIEWGAYPAALRVPRIIPGGAGKANQPLAKATDMPEKACEFAQIVAHPPHPLGAPLEFGKASGDGWRPSDR